jgi:hypothetical protein
VLVGSVRGGVLDRVCVREDVAKGVAPAAVVVGAAARELAVLGAEAGLDDVVGAAVGVLGEDGGREEDGGGEEEGLHVGGCGGGDDASKGVAGKKSGDDKQLKRQ